jgi:peptidoglycan-N-acetylglucosamine deacetylase
MRGLLCAMLGLLPVAPVLADSPFAWPQGHHAAISLTYDDAVAVSDLDVAVPQLNRAGLKGTFFLMGKAMSPADVPRWRAVAVAGHELGNHTVNHPCQRGSFPMPAQYNSESYSVEVLLTEVGVMNTLLTAIDGKLKHAFATPCGQTTAGGEDYIKPLQAAGLASFIRDNSTLVAGGSGPKILGTGFVGSSGADMIAWIKTVERAGALGVIVFHGVGGDYLSVSADAHRQLLDYLAAQRSAIWITTFSDAMAYVAARGL